MKAAKEKSFLLIFAIASALFVCAPTIASSTHVSTAETRAELFLPEAQNRVGQQAFDTAKHVENYDPSWEVALESSVAPKGTMTGGISRIPNDRIPFADLDHTSVALRPLSSAKIKITNRGIDLVDGHLSRFVDDAGRPFANNTVMLRDLRQIAAGKMKPTQIHKDFYAHELREMVRYRNAGVPVGQQMSLGRHLNSHYATLREYSIPFKDHGDFLYTPEALEALLRQMMW